jgi:methyltransferase (TIGR00027 family)
MVVAGVRAVYGKLPTPLGIGPEPLAANVLPGPYLLPAHLAALAGKSPLASVSLHRVYGAISAGMTYHVALRTLAIDEALRQALAAGAKQIVVLGAGLDGRAFRMPELEGLRVFEVDHPNTQRDKQERLSRTHVQRRADIEFVAVDFEHDRLDESLVKAGFSRNVPSFWIWEGVTVYLTRDAVQSSLRAMASLSAPGSRVALTYSRPPSQSADSTRPILYRTMRALVHAGSKVLGQIGESVRNFIDSPTMAELAREAGFVVLSDENAADWSARFWPGEPHGPFEWERIAVLERAER